MWDEAASKFKFDIGDAVIHATTAHHGASAVRFVVIEQSLVRCHGGIQRFYVASSLVQDGVFTKRQKAYEGGREQFNETELIAAPPAETEAERYSALLDKFKAKAKGARPEDIAPVD